MLLYAHRADAVDHERYRAWLTAISTAAEAFGFSELVASAFVRIVTNPKVFKVPTPIETALEVVGALYARQNCVRMQPGSRHWQIFADLCRSVGAKGNIVPDAYLAALAIESGSEWITTDRGYARFPGLRWRHPFDEGVSERVTRYRTRPRPPR